MGSPKEQDVVSADFSESYQKIPSNLDQSSKALVNYLDNDMDLMS